MIKTRPMLITVTGPSGTGKDAVINALVEQDVKVRCFATATTRAPRPGEVDSIHYYFLTREQYLEKEAAGEFWETDKRNYSGHWYGTLRKVVEGHFAAGYDVISDINFVGVRQFAEKVPERLFRVLILPPSPDRLLQRLTGRNPALAEEGRRRFNEMKDDLDHLHDPRWVFTNPDMVGSTYLDYDLVLVNDVLDHTVSELARCVNSERARRA